MMERVPIRPHSDPLLPNSAFPLFPHALAAAIPNSDSLHAGAIGHHRSGERTERDSGGRPGNRQIEEQLQGVAATLSDSTSTFPLNDWVLRKCEVYRGTEFVFTDANGTILASSSPLRLSTSDNSAVVENSKQLRLGPPVEIGGQRFFEMTLAMKERGQQQPGRLHILSPERVWQEARNEAIVPPLVVGGLALAATALVGMVISNRLTRPIIKLRSQVSRIAQADYTPIPLPERDDEIRPWPPT